MIWASLAFILHQISVSMSHIIAIANIVQISLKTTWVERLPDLQEQSFKLD